MQEREESKREVNEEKLLGIKLINKNVALRLFFLFSLQWVNQLVLFKKLSQQRIITLFY